MSKLHVVKNSGKKYGRHICKLYDLSSALRFMAEKFELDERHGESYLLETMAGTVLDAATAFDELQGEVKRATNG